MKTHKLVHENLRGVHKNLRVSARKSAPGVLSLFSFLTGSSLYCSPNMNYTGTASMAIPEADEGFGGFEEFDPVKLRIPDGLSVPCRQEDIPTTKRLRAKKANVSC